MPSDSTTVQRGGDYVEADAGEQTLMMSIAAQKYFALEGTGKRIWEMLAQPVTVESIVDSLAQEYDVPRETCEAEVRGFLDELRRNGLLKE